MLDAPQSSMHKAQSLAILSLVVPEMDALGFSDWAKIVDA
jgi:hypothetical protein